VHWGISDTVFEAAAQLDAQPTGRRKDTNDHNVLEEPHVSGMLEPSGGRTWLAASFPQYSDFDAGFYVVDRGAIEVIAPGVVLGAVLGCH
jgi:hypothetical protein